MDNQEKMNKTAQIPMTESMIQDIYKQIDETKERISFAEMTRRLITEALTNRGSKKEVDYNVG